MSTEPNREPAEVIPTSASTTSDERTHALLCHLGGLFTSFIAPLIIWLMKRDTSRFVNEHGREALNFQISMVIYSMVAGLSVMIFIGLLLIPALIIFEIVVIIQACIAANRGDSYRYPLCIRLIKE